MPITINGSGTVTGVSVGGLPDGIVDTDTLAAKAATAPKRGAGSVLQVVYNEMANEADRNTTSSTFQSTNCDAVITPIGTNSNILVIAHNRVQNSNNGTGGGCQLRLVRGATALGPNGSTGLLTEFGSGNEMSTDTLMFLDTTNGLSGATTYAIEFHASSGGTAFFQGYSMTLMEIAT